MNTNFLHNLLNFAIAAVAVLSVPEVVALLPAALAVKITGSLAAVKLIINIIRDGVGGLTKDQPPVK